MKRLLLAIAVVFAFSLTTSVAKADHGHRPPACYPPVAHGHGHHHHHHYARPNPYQFRGYSPYVQRYYGYGYGNARYGVPYGAHYGYGTRYGYGSGITFRGPRVGFSIGF